jgi:hypothetical protein
MINYRCLNFICGGTLIVHTNYILLDATFANFWTFTLCTLHCIGGIVD